MKPHRRSRLMEVLDPDVYEHDLIESLSDDDLLDIINRYLLPHIEARQRVLGEPAEDLAMDVLIAASSLGTPIARYFRSLRV